MPPLTQEFLHHLHELMVETGHLLREELNGYKNRLVWEAQKRGNSAGIPIAYSDAAVYAYRTRVEATIKRYLDALDACGITVDAAVERDMLQQITLLTAAPKHLNLPPGVTGPTISAVQAEHGRKMERAANALRREAANRLRELKMKASRNVAAVLPMTPPQPFTIASVAPTLAAVKALPVQEQATLLLRRLAYLFPQVKSTGGFNKHNILLPGDTTGIAYGFADNEKMRVLEHLLGAPWTRLVNAGFLVDLRDSKFFVVTDEGFAAAEQAAKPQPPEAPNSVLPEPTPADSLDGVPTVFISYSWDSPEHKEWVLRLAERLHGEDGVNVILDRWHLRMGADKLLFMEKSIAASDRVLIVCTPEYARKANEREGGVGYEATIITAEIAENIQKTKFIPVLRQGKWDSTSMPSWLKTRIGPDLRTDDSTAYRELVDELHGDYPKPPELGKKRQAPSPETVPAEAVTQPVSAMPIQSAIAYAFYETKGVDAHRVEVYVRPTDAAKQHFVMETSTDENASGTLDVIAHAYHDIDFKLRNRGYTRMNTFNGSGGQSFNLP